MRQTLTTAEGMTLARQAFAFARMAVAAGPCAALAAAAEAIVEARGWSLACAGGGGTFATGDFDTAFAGGGVFAIGAFLVGL